MLNFLVYFTISIYLYFSVWRENDVMSIFKKRTDAGRRTYDLYDDYAACSFS